jgi:two-component system NtrC family response regulator
VAEQAGDLEEAGQATLTMIEELGQHLTFSEMNALYERADRLLIDSKDLDILERLRQAAKQVIARRNARLAGHNTSNFIYATREMATLLRQAHSLSNVHQTLLLTGETGTGKGLLAGLIHEWSGRTGEFVVVRGAAPPPAPLLESQLFGHRRGSFPEALEDSTGAVRQAQGGTLFLSDIAEFSLSDQGKLLRLIECGEIHTIGAPLPERVDVRIIAASSCDLRQKMRQGQFRKGLFYRLQALHLLIPPLRERTDDTVALAEYFIKEMRAKQAKEVLFTPEAIAAMRLLPLPSNATELRELIERTFLWAKSGTVITREAIEVVALRRTQKVSFANPWEGFSLKEEVGLFEGRYIELALKEAKGRISHAAKLLGFKHHESLNSLLATKHQSLLEARAPITPRKRSIMRHHPRTKSRYRRS